MPGTLAGGRKARDTIKAKDPHHYEKIGRNGGLTGDHSKKGFAVKDPEWVAEMGRRGVAARMAKRK